MKSFVKTLAGTSKLFSAAFLSATPILLLGSTVQAAPVGTITVCYWSTTCSYPATIGLSGLVDAPAFEITNTGSLPIKAARFKILPNTAQGVAMDTFHIGTIPANSSVVLVPQYSNDGGVHPSGSFWFWTGTPLDTSDLGPDSDHIKFVFRGTVAKAPVGSGVIVTGTTAGPSNDNTVDPINFLGGPHNADGICNNCVGPYQIGTIQ